MRKFDLTQFDLRLMAAVSTAMLALSGCRSAYTNNSAVPICVTGTDNVRVDEQYCQPQAYGFYRWYYVSRGGLVPPVGYGVSSGVYCPNLNPACPVPRHVTTSRGGFGASMHTSGVGA